MRHAACAACNMHQYRSGYTYARVKPRELNRQDNSLFERLFRRCSASAYRKPTTDVARAAQVCAKSRCEAQSATTRRGLLTHARCALGVARCKLHAVATRLRARPRLPTSRWASSSRSTTRGSLKRKALRGRQRSSSSARQAIAMHVARMQACSGYVLAELCFLSVVVVVGRAAGALLHLPRLCTATYGTPTQTSQAACLTGFFCSFLSTTECGGAGSPFKTPSARADMAGDGARERPEQQAAGVISDSSKQQC